MQKWSSVSDSTCKDFRDFHSVLIPSKKLNNWKMATLHGPNLWGRHCPTSWRGQPIQGVWFTGVNTDQWKLPQNKGRGRKAWKYPMNCGRLRTDLREKLQESTREGTLAERRTSFYCASLYCAFQMLFFVCLFVKWTTSFSPTLARWDTGEKCIHIIFF